ncbi:MAG: protoporphyrinogen oxidase [Rhodospirillales bacterium]|nr:protoporphyrinogen oxidase [Rhodospirillales bacterium]
MTESHSRRALIIGGGISGLSAAWFLHARGYDIRLIEAAERVGGVISTSQRNDFMVERGPNTTLQKPGRPEDALGRLLEGAGLASRVIEAAPTGKKRFILRNGRVLALPGSPPAFVTSPAFSWPAKLRLLKEPFIGRATQEESIAQFVERRLGREFLDYAVDPFISGVYAGDTRALSVRAAVPRIFELEQQYGSLIRGALALGKAAKSAGMPAGRQISFDRGMSGLPQGIAEKLPPGTIATGLRAQSIEHSGGTWRVLLAGDGGNAEETGDVLILALPADETARLIAPLSAEAARIIGDIPYVSISSVGLGYAREQIGHSLDGFGFLAPRVEGMRTLGALFSSTLFDGRAPQDHVLMTAFIGGAHDAKECDLPTDTIFELVEADLAAALKIDGKPVFRHISRYGRAIPQYTLGHLDRISDADRQLQPFAGIYLRGNWRDGISVADCVRAGEDLADRVCGGVT